MQKIILRIFLITLLAIFFGLVFNQISSKGIPVKLLLSSNNISEKNSDKIHFVTADSALSLLSSQEVLFLDVRPEKDYKFDHITGAVNIPFNDIFKNSYLNKFSSKTLIIYDKEGNFDELKIVGKMLIKAKVKSVHILIGGYFAWLKRNYPVEFGENFED